MLTSGMLPAHDANLANGKNRVLERPVQGNEGRRQANVAPIVSNARNMTKLMVSLGGVTKRVTFPLNSA